MRKNSISTWLALFIVVFAGCGKNDHDAVGPVAVLTLSVASAPVYLYGSLENWVIVHDEQGALVDYRKFERGTDVVIETEKPLPGSTIGVSLLRYSNDRPEQWTITSYLQIAIGSKFTLSNALPTHFGDSGATTGTFAVDVTGLGQMDECFLTSNIGDACGAVGNDGEASFTCSTTTNASKYLLVLADLGFGDSRYKILDNVKPDDKYSLSYAEMSPFDKYYSFVFPATNDVLLYTTGKEPGQTEGQGYVTNYHFKDDIHTQIQAGYLNSLTDYNTVFQARYPNYTYVYNNRGSIPEGEIDWPSRPDYSLVKTSVNDFESSVNKSFSYRQSTWIYLTPAENPQKRILWTVFGTTEKHTFIELPAEIVAKYPDLTFNNLKHTGSSYFSGTKSYTDLLSDEFGNGEPKPGTSKAITIW